MNKDSIEQAKATVDAMPLVAAGLAKYQLWPVATACAAETADPGQVGDGGAEQYRPAPFVCG
jgi:hypothetical protein